MGAVLNTVYNNYLSSYTPKGLTRYDSHKKSELRSVYNSIVKLNKESPWYLPTTNKDTQFYAVDIKENARGLHNTLAQLGVLEENGLFNKKSAYSTNPDVANATFLGSQSPDNVVPSFSIEVQSLASSQENMGLFLNNDKVNLKPDSYSFDVAINDMNYEFQFSIGEGETNRDVQERLVRLINNSDIGIKASLIEEDSRTSLRLESSATGLPLGKSNIFSITDNHTSKTAGTVEYFGLDYTSREASNAHFLINGEERSASSNHFTVGKMFEVQLNGISPADEPTQIGLKTDIDSLTDNVTNLIGGYNDFVKAVSTYLDSQPRSKQLVREMQGIASLYNSSLEHMGINFTEEGTLEVNQRTLRNAALHSDNISETFGHLRDFSNSLLKKSNQVSLSPMDYVEKTIVAYKNPGHNFVSPYAASAYSGMMFNGYC